MDPLLSVSGEETTPERPAPPALPSLLLSSLAKSTSKNVSILSTLVASTGVTALCTGESSNACLSCGVGPLQPVPVLTVQHSSGQITQRSITPSSWMAIDKQLCFPESFLICKVCVGGRGINVMLVGLLKELEEVTLVDQSI